MSAIVTQNPTLTMKFNKVYWEVRAGEGWCASFEHTSDDLQDIIEQVCPDARVEVTATSHGLYGDMLGLTFSYVRLTKSVREKFLTLLQPDCEFWRMQELQVKVLQRLGRAPLFLVSVSGKMKFVTILEAYKLFSDKLIQAEDIGRYVLERDLSCREITDFELRLIIMTEPES